MPSKMSTDYSIRQSIFLAPNKIPKNEIGTVPISATKNVWFSDRKYDEKYGTDHKTTCVSLWEIRNWPQSNTRKSVPCCYAFTKLWKLLALLSIAFNSRRREKGGCFKMRIFLLLLSFAVSLSLGALAACDSPGQLACAWYVDYKRNMFKTSIFLTHFLWRIF